MPYRFLIIALILITSASCRKRNVDCDAQICVVNQKSDTVRYCWGCNSYNEKLAPGTSVCRPVGHITIKHGIFGTQESTVDVFFNTSGATYQIPVDECNEERILVD